MYYLACSFVATMCTVFLVPRVTIPTACASECGSPFRSNGKTFPQRSGQNCSCVSLSRLVKPRQRPSPLRQIPTTTDIFYDGIRVVARPAFRIDPTSTLRVMRVPRLRNGTVERGMRLENQRPICFCCGCDL